MCTDLIDRYESRIKSQAAGVNPSPILAIKGQLNVVQDALPPLIRMLYADCPGHPSLNSFLSNGQNIAQLIAMRGKPLVDVHELLIRELSHLDDVHRCFAPACVASELDGRMRLCMGCQRDKYCSRYCQKKAWRHKQAAHRDVCAALAGVPNTKDLSVSSTKAGIKLAIARLILSHLEKMTLLKLKALNPDVDVRFPDPSVLR